MADVVVVLTYGGDGNNVVVILSGKDGRCEDGR